MNLVGGGSTAGTPSTSWTVQTRTAVPTDREFVLSMIPHMVASSPAHWRNPRKMRAAYLEVIESILATSRSDAAMLIAEHSSEIPAGLVLLSSATSCYTHRRQGQLAQIAVVRGWSECRVSSLLARAAERWAASRSQRLLWSDEFWDGHPARVLHQTSDRERESGTLVSVPRRP